MTEEEVQKHRYNLRREQHKRYYEKHKEELSLKQKIRYKKHYQPVIKKKKVGVPWDGIIKQLPYQGDVFGGGSGYVRHKRKAQE